MNRIGAFLLGLAALGTGSLAACGEARDGDDDPGPSTGGSSASGSSSGSGTGGGGEPKQLVELKGPIGKDTTLGSDKDYLMKGLVFVQPGATLTIEKGTRIMGEKVSLATLVVMRGAKIIAEGTREEPIVFTSQGEPGERAAGDWGGVIVLGDAPINVPGGKANVEGIVGGGTEYGGTDAEDDSGILRYVRIEFSGILLSPDNEVNGLTLAGVGSKTVVDHILVQHTLDDCFEFFGGTVNASHLACAYNGDDGFDWDYGYRGKLQFLALQQDPSIADDTNGFEGDNDPDGSLNTPVSEPTIYNATLCGKNVDVDKQQYGMLLRRSTRAHIFNTIVTGFEAGIDIRNALTDIDLQSSIFFGNLAENIAYAETDTNPDNKSSTLYDDDGGLDEVAWFMDAAKKNSVVDPKLAGCFKAGAPDFRPAVTLETNAATPPDDGFFDATAKYIGAFKAGDDWLSGPWATFHQN